MRKQEYRDFSLRLHQKNWQANKPNLCHFELSFACPLHCSYCYTNCYNNPEHIKRQLKTKEVMRILDKLYDYGVFWLCLTGGDPLARSDFAQLYSYAKKKGFIVVVFTSGMLIDSKIIKLFRELRPFCLELTLNSLNPLRHDYICRRNGSCAKIISVIKRLLKERLPLKVKTMAFKDNYPDLGEVKRFLEKNGLQFRMSSLLFPRLDGDLSPCSLRLEPEKILAIEDRLKAKSIAEEEEEGRVLRRNAGQDNYLFRCGAGRDSIYVDPYGNMFLCPTFRQPSVNLLSDTVTEGFALFNKMLKKKYGRSTKCASCRLWYICHQCPGRAYLETGDMQAPVKYYCELAHAFARRPWKKSR